MSGGWTPPPSGAARRRERALPPTHKSVAPNDEYVPTDVETLMGHTKLELATEVNRLERTLFDCAVELGIARRTPSSEFKIDLHFVTHLMLTLAASNRMRIK